MDVPFYRAEGFFCSKWRPRDRLIAIFDQKAVFFLLQFLVLVIKTRDPDFRNRIRFRIRIHLKCWIRIRINLIRIHNSPNTAQNYFHAESYCIIFFHIMVHARLCEYLTLHIYLKIPKWVPITAILKSSEWSCRFPPPSNRLRENIKPSSPSPSCSSSPSSSSPVLFPRGLSVNIDAAAILRRLGAHRSNSSAFRP